MRTLPATRFQILSWLSFSCDRNVHRLIARDVLFSRCEYAKTCHLYKIEPLILNKCLWPSNNWVRLPLDVLQHPTGCKRTLFCCSHSCCISVNYVRDEEGQKDKNSPQKWFLWGTFTSTNLS